MREPARVVAVAHALAQAISQRDASAVANYLVPAFVLRSPGKAPIGIHEFLAGIRQLPEGIEFVRLRDLEVDVDGDHALVTGLQHACVRIDTQVVHEVRPFVDWFVRAADDEWRVRAALDLPPVTCTAAT